MNIEEFDNTQWKPGMRAMYKGNKHNIVACEFNEGLVALEGVASGSDEPSWVRCESIELVDE